MVDAPHPIVQYILAISILTALKENFVYSTSQLLSSFPMHHVHYCCAQLSLKMAFHSSELKAAIFKKRPGV